ncbi:hypothetical protein [Dokdonella sp.]|uniref:hypothetical protein n=1 Tax=Dokdonella sp. TaxID=2291710 RepID=UPI001B0EE964|nr:hypothetical protein [Dokdonella sp.]MBO9661822.1 hypothetical protein [Dokdonella sp.]
MPTPTRFLPRLLPAVLAAAFGADAVAGAPMYHLTVLGVPGGSVVQAADINDVGQIVGRYMDADFNGRAVLWDADGTAHPLGVPGAGDIYAYALNNQGQIVGVFLDYVNPVAGLLWTAAAPDQSIRLSDDPNINISPNDINDAGVVVGGFGVPAQERAFVWTAEGGLVDYGVQDPTVEFQQARWLGVNESGKLVGYWNVHSSTIHATGGQVGTPAVNSLGAMSEEFPSLPTAVNAAGTAVGLGLAVETPNLVPVVFGADGSFTEIPGAVLDQENGCASAINDAGVIVGSAGIGTASGCVPGLKIWVYRDGVAYDLYEVVDDHGPFARFQKAAAINADGVIVGFGRDADEGIAAFMLTPIASDAIFADGFDG